MQSNNVNDTIPMEVSKKLDEILNLLRGNPLNKEDGGVVGQVNTQEDRITRLEKFKDRMIHIVIGMGIPASIGVVEILKKLLIK